MIPVSIVGTGPGTADYLLPIARRTIDSADTLVGAPRLIDAFAHPRHRCVPVGGVLEEVIERIHARGPEERMAVLVSGDPGVFSLATWLSRRLPPEEYEIIPGLSSYQLAMARLKRSSEGVRLLSLHGRELDEAAPAADPCACSVVYTDHRATPGAIAHWLLEHGSPDRPAAVASRLGYPDERIVRTSLRGLASKQGEADTRGVDPRLNLLIVLEAEGGEDET